jgi:hypothetical protein
METVCHNQLRFESLFQKEVIADFEGGRITSDAGGLLLRKVDQRYLQGTELATAQVNTLRLKLLKIGARIRETSRRIWVHLASGYPYRDLLAGLLQSLRASPA